MSIHHGCPALRSPHLPARREILRLSLRDELPDDLSSGHVEVRAELLELLPRLVIQPQHEARGIRTGIVGALAWCRLLPAGGEIREGDLAHHMAQPWRGF